jgi:hypothetical protein
VKYLVGYILQGSVIVEAENEDEAKGKLKAKLPSWFDAQEAVIVTAREMPEELE